MSTKSYLQQLYWKRRHLDRISQQIRDLEQDIISVRAMDYTKDRIDSSNQTSAVEEAVIRLEAHKEKLLHIQEEYVILRVKIETEIESLDNDVFKELLSLRYVQCLRWERIALLMGYSEPHVFELHRDALDYFDKQHKLHSKS